MTDAWFVGKEGDRSGPFSADVLREMAALRMSWSRVSIGRACSLFGLFLVAGVVGMLSLIVLFVGSPLIGVPFCFAVLGSAYQLLFRSDRAAKSAG